MTLSKVFGVRGVHPVDHAGWVGFSERFFESRHLASFDGYPMGAVRGVAENDLENQSRHINERLYRKRESQIAFRFGAHAELLHAGSIT